MAAIIAVEKSLRSRARRWVRKRLDLEDALQIGRLAAWQALTRYDGKRPLDAYLYTVAKNAIFSALRQRVMESEDLDTVTLSATPVLYSAGVIIESLAVLTERQRALILRHYVDGQSLADIARDWTLTRAAVGQQHARAVERLRAALNAAGVFRVADLI